MFKFKIGQKVHHKGYCKNMVVRAKIIYEDCDVRAPYYDLYFVDLEGKTIDMVPEFWLEDGHRVE